jgi:hypothetical protein
MPQYFEPSSGGSWKSEFSSKLTTRIPRSMSAGKPLTLAEYRAFRGDGPANPVFYDGVPQPYIRDLSVKVRRVRRAA